MKNRIIIIGKMGSGKTTMAKKLVEECGFIKFSLADKVKDIAKDLFRMKAKDRILLQQIGCKMREIRQFVWVDYLNKKIRDTKNCDELLIIKDDFRAVIDDVRFINEYAFFVGKGWFPVKLDVNFNKRVKRLKGLYKSVTKEQLNDVSETEIDLIDCPNIIYETLEMTVDEKWDELKKMVGAGP